MDLTTFKLNIDELLGEFVEGNCLTFADMKRIWKERKFSYIFEAKPTRNSAFFMQSLYTHCISHMISAVPLPRRLGALYILYCLHEIQPYQPGFKIYLSLGELTKLGNLLGEAKAYKLEVVPALVKKMLVKNMFLFGFVDVLGTTEWSSGDDTTGQPNWRLEAIYDKLFADGNIEKYMHIDLGADIEVENFKKNLSEYELAKELAIQEASKTTDISDVEHIIEKNKSTGDVMEEIVHKWDARKKMIFMRKQIPTGSIKSRRRLRIILTRSWRTCWENEQPLLMDVFAFLTASTVSCFLVTTLDIPVLPKNTVL